MELSIPNMLLNLIFGKDGLVKIVICVLYRSNELLKLCVILFIPKLKRNASFSNCSKSATGNEL